MAITWSDARTKVRGDLWKSASGVPDDVVDRALHSSLREIESKRNWLWLENITVSDALAVDSAIIALPSDMRSIRTLSFKRAGAVYMDPPLTRIELDVARTLATGVSIGWPSGYAYSQGNAYLDCVAEAGSIFELVYTSRTPERLEDAIAAAYIPTLDLHQDLAIAGAAARVALSFLRDETNAGRQQAKFDRAIDILVDIEDDQRADLTGPRIQPDTSYQDMAR